MNRALALAAAACIGLTVVACSSDEAGTPTADNTAGHTDEKSAKVPTVSRPIQELDRFMQSPCRMVPKEEASAIGFNEGLPETDQDQGPACEWRNDNGEHFAIVLLKNQPLGIAGLYRNHEQFDDFYKYFEPVDIAGYPGVFADGYDARPNGACTLGVGVTGQQIITVTTRVRSQDPCQVAKKAAEAAVTTMSSS
jgi:hypothetical protein